MSIEVDPRTVTRCARPPAAARLQPHQLRRQDFDPQVQQAVHRVQPFESVRELMQGAARWLRVDQRRPHLRPAAADARRASRAPWRRSAELRPDRIALYAYAHLPQRFKPQRRILPSSCQRGAAAAHAGGAIAGFSARLPLHRHGPLSRCPTTRWRSAKRQGRLQRNFQGYSTQPDCDLVGPGRIAIGRIGA
jgi:oxygen-independent coproporphyrinogen-3 oxidase